MPMVTTSPICNEIWSSQDHGDGWQFPCCKERRAHLHCKTQYLLEHLEFAATMTTPAPTLEELPPEKGTILKLHSIGDEQYDGKLVEYLKAGSNRGKIYVSLLEDTNSSMQVKIKCCRRPDILPVEFRALLSSLASQIRESVENSENYESAEGDIARLESLLSKDPCCIFAHHTIGIIMQKIANDFDFERGTFSLSKEMLLEAIPHYRRAIANWYAYQDLSGENYQVDLERYLSILFFTTEKFDSAGRSHKRVQKKVHMPSSLCNQIADTAQKGSVLFGKANNLVDDRHKQVELYLASADCHFRVLKMAVSNRSNVEYVSDVNHELDSSIAIQCVTTILMQLYASATKCNETQYDERHVIAKAFSRIHEDLLKACTAEDGTVMFLQAADVEKWNDDEIYVRVQRVNQRAADKMSAFFARGRR